MGEAMNSVLEELDVEVYQESGWTATEFQIGNDLGLVNRCEFTHSLALDDDTTLD